MTRIEEYLTCYGWIGERIDENTWRSSYTDEHEVDHDVYIMDSEHWLYFAVSPLFARPVAENSDRLNELMLRINQGLPAVALAIDDDGDINLVSALPAADVSYIHFAGILDVLTQVTVELAHELQRIGLDGQYRSARFGSAYMKRTGT